MSLEADGMITIYDIETGVVIAKYEGLEVHEAMLAMKAAQHRVQADASPVAPECNHVWLHNIEKGWKVCDKCGERR